MKRAERHHLKDNELATFAVRARQLVETQGKPLGALAVVLVVVVVAVLGYLAWRGRAEARAGAVLAEATLLDEARVGPPPAEGGPAEQRAELRDARAKKPRRS